MKTLLSIVLSFLCLSCCGQTQLGIPIASPGCTAPSISVQPSSVVCETNTDAVFAVTASGTGPHFYQWRSNAVNLVDGVDFSGVTTASMTASNVLFTNNFTVVITNTCGSITSSVATLNPTNGPAGSAWHDQISDAGTDDDNALNPNVLIWSEVTVPTGTATKLRIDSSVFIAEQHVALGLYNIGGTLLQSVTVDITGNGYFEGVISNQGVTSGTYYVAFSCENNGFSSVRWKNGVGTTHYNATLGASLTLPSTLPADEGPLTRSYAVGIFVQ